MTNFSIRNNQGFTLIEIVIVVAVLAIMGMAVIPAVSGFFSSRSENFKILTSMLARTYDDAFLRDKVNYLVIHLDGMDTGVTEEDKDIFRRKNGLSVVNFEDSKFIDNDRRTLRHRQFSDSFRITAVLTENSDPITSGNVLIPFYPEGRSDNIIIHVLTDNSEEWSVRIYKHLKEASVTEGYNRFETVY